MTKLTCGCTVTHSDDEPENHWCATWEESAPEWEDEGNVVECYGSLCDKCLIVYGAERCELGGGRLHNN